MTVPGGFTASTTLAASSLNSFPAGRVTHATQTTAQTGIGTSATDLTSLSVSVTTTGTRRYKITGLVNIVQQATATLGVLYLYRSGTQLHAVSANLAGTVYGIGITVVVYDAPAAGTYTYKLAAAANSGTINTATASTAPGLLLVEDIGST